VKIDLLNAKWTKRAYGNKININCNVHTQTGSHKIEYRDGINDELKSQVNGDLEYCIDDKL